MQENHAEELVIAQPVVVYSLQHMAFHGRFLGVFSSPLSDFPFRILPTVIWHHITLSILHLELSTSIVEQSANFPKVSLLDHHTNALTLLQQCRSADLAPSGLPWVLPSAPRSRTPRTKTGNPILDDHLCKVRKAVPRAVSRAKSASTRPRSRQLKLCSQSRRRDTTHTLTELLISWQPYLLMRSQLIRRPKYSNS